MKNVDTDCRGRNRRDRTGKMRIVDGNYVAL